MDLESQVIHPCNQPDSFLGYCFRTLNGVEAKILVMMGFFYKMIYDLTGPSKDLGIDYKNFEMSLRFSEAFGKSRVNIVQMTLFLVLNVSALFLTSFRPQFRATKFLIKPMLILTPIYYFALFYARAPNYSVRFGTFELQIFWFQFYCSLVFLLLLGCFFR
ncbi:hypothetical protein QN277_008900 [Acacia crassicarpa]|uniref:Uncharacterized protein n=1 Tax=Acacia crassicarpa TaxID=499986 RepID=A0AAE1ISU9_9FABA|nr:hypothetical protein QN277_008900 [Acacia crassicarpa]